MWRQLDQQRKGHRGGATGCNQKDGCRPTGCRNAQSGERWPHHRGKLERAFVVTAGDDPARHSAHRARRGHGGRRISAAHILKDGAR